MGRGSIIVIVVDIVVRNGVTLGQPFLLSMNPLFFSHRLLSTATDQEGNPQRPAAIEYDLVRFGGKTVCSNPL